MSLGKKDIVNNIFSEAFLSKSDAKNFLESFLGFIKNNRSRNIKISNFGTFSNHKSPRRIGRNPKTRVEARILARKIIKFKPSTLIKEKLNHQ